MIPAMLECCRFATANADALRSLVARLVCVVPVFVPRDSVPSGTTDWCRRRQPTAASLLMKRVPAGRQKVIHRLRLSSQRATPLRIVGHKNIESGKDESAIQA